MQLATLLFLVLELGLHYVIYVYSMCVYGLRKVVKIRRHQTSTRMCTRT